MNEKEARARGTGSKFQKRGFWYVKVYDHGKVHYESTGLRGAAGEKKADRLLGKYTAEIEEGKFQKPTKPLDFEDLAAMLKADYMANERKSLDRALRSSGHLRAFLKGMRATVIPGRVPEYIAARLKKAKPATVRLELAALKRMFTLAYRAGRIPSRPYIASVAVRNTRQGFFEDDQFLAVLGHLKPHLKPLAQFAYLTGWRKQEILDLEWRQVDFQAQTLRLEPGTTKNDEGRTFPFGDYPQLKALLLEQREHTSAVEHATARIIPNVFHKGGWPIRDYYTAWNNATKAAGVPGRLLHDLRRTAVRNLERAGVPRSYAMKLTGHKTEAVYRRYAIVSEADLSGAVKKLSQAAEARAAASQGRES